MAHAPVVLVVMEPLVLMHIMGITVLVRMHTLVDNVKQVSESELTLLFTGLIIIIIIII
jgi:hypothetical protein